MAISRDLLKAENIKSIVGVCVCVCACAHVLSYFSHVRLFATLWTIACQAPLSKGFSRQEYWSGLPYPPPRDFSNPGIELESLTSPALAGSFFTMTKVLIEYKMQH